MKTKQIILYILLFMPLGLLAQNNISVYWAKMDSIFMNADRSKVTTGLLSDYGIQSIPPEYYDGALRDSNDVNIDVWKTLYEGLYFSKFNNNCTLQAKETVYSSIDAAMPASNQVIPIVSMCISYNRFRTDAYTAGLVNVVNNQIRDVAGKNPYETKMVFAAAPLVNSFDNANASFVLKKALYYTNVSNKTVSQMYIDMGNGSGYKTIAWDTPFSVSYSSAGIKTFTVKFVYSDGSTLYTHGKMSVQIPAVVQKSSTEYSYDDFFRIEANTSRLGGTVEIAYGKGHTKIMKPLIVAEGFDTWKIMTPQNSRMNTTISHLITSETDNLNLSFGHLFVSVTAGTTLKNYLFEKEYDIIYLDYDDGTGDIKKNAALFKEVIRQVNTKKNANGSPEPNVVMGLSMGGLVARIALRQLEQEGYDHQTKLYISMDTPHNGANVPFGLQAAVNKFNNYNNIVHFDDNMTRAYNLLNSGAAKQMLIYKLDGTSLDNTHANFMNYLNTLGFPEKCYNIAISDGANNPNNVYCAPGTELINYDYSKNFKWWQGLVFSIASFSNPHLVKNIIPGKTELKAECNIYATPSSAGRVFHFKIYIEKKLLWFIPVKTELINDNTNSVSGMLPIDGAQGGIYDIDNMIGPNAFPADMLSAVKVRQFCFVPTVSALALNNWQAYYNSNISNIDFVANGGTNVQGYYNRSTTNNIHTSFFVSGNSLADYIKTCLDNTSSICTTTTAIKNRTLSKSQTIVGCSLNIENVSIQNNSSVVFDATFNSSITGPFEVQSGSSLTIQ